MDGTPKMQRRFSLSLNRLSNKRQIGSPQNRLQVAQSMSAVHSVSEETPRSPSVLSIYSDNSVHTPPHRKLNLDDSLGDYSPKCFDTSFSPSGLLSQTLAIDSPEVGWRWQNEIATTTPDSAYADSSFTSVGSSRETSSVRTRGDAQRQAYQLRREEHRKAIELKIRRAEKVRTDELLKRRCAKLQEQLKEAETQKGQNLHKQEFEIKAQTTTFKKQSSLRCNKMSLNSSNSIAPTTATSISTVDSTSTVASTAIFASTSTVRKTMKNDSFSAFFNDSDTDGFLLEASQHLESQIVELSQKSAPLPVTRTSTVTNSPTYGSKEGSKEKRSSFYMKFLEEDSPEDWFESLDEAVRLATQAKKPRTSFQRYNSMPATTTTTAIGGCDGQLTATQSTAYSAKISNNSSGSYSLSTSSYGSGNISNANAAVPKMKRHASTHAMSPSSSSYRGRQLHMRK